MACAQLHNFIIEEDMPEDENDNDGDIDPGELNIIAMPNAPLGMCYNPTMLDDEFVQYSGVSQTHTAMVELIAENSYQCPIHNLLRNGFNPHKIT